MTRQYEAVYIFDSTLEDTAINDRISRFHGLLSSTVDVAVEHWGSRQLSYPIVNKENGYYAISRFDAEPAKLR